MQPLHFILLLISSCVSQDDITSAYSLSPEPVSGIRAVYNRDTLEGEQLDGFYYFSGNLNKAEFKSDIQYVGTWEDSSGKYALYFFSETIQDSPAARSLYALISLTNDLSQLTQKPLKVKSLKSSRPLLKDFQESQCFFMRATRLQAL